MFSFKGYSSSGTNTHLEHLEDSIINDGAKGGSFIFSKNMCLLFLDTMMSATSTQRNKVCTDIIKYAASSTDLSSFYVKVS